MIKLNETRIKDAPPLEEVRAEVTEDVRAEAVQTRVEELTEAGTVTRLTVEDIDPALLDDRSLIEN